MSDDRVKPEGWQRDSLENYGIPSNPQERRAFQKEKMGEMQKSVKEASSQGRTTTELTGGRRRYFVNNKARPIHLPDEEIVIDGQLAVSARGPFVELSDEKVESSFQFQTLLEKPLSRTNPHLKDKTVIEEVTKEEYKLLYREYLKQKAIRDRENAKEKDNVGRHEDGTIDEEDAEFEIRKINPKILRQQGG